MSEVGIYNKSTYSTNYETTKSFQPWTSEYVRFVKFVKIVIPLLSYLLFSLSPPSLSRRRCYDSIRVYLNYPRRKRTDGLKEKFFIAVVLQDGQIREYFFFYFIFVTCDVEKLCFKLYGEGIDDTFSGIEMILDFDL